jgi:hypothetical protein
MIMLAWRFPAWSWDNRAAVECSNRTVRQRPTMTGKAFELRQRPLPTAVPLDGKEEFSGPGRWLPVPS